MSALHKLKAYFGMVPAEYADDPGYDDDRGRYGDYRSEYAAEADDYDPYPRRSRVFTPGRSELQGSGYRADIDEPTDSGPESRRGASPSSTRRWSADAPVHGALAVEPQREPVSRLRPVAEPAGNPLARITTPHPAHERGALPRRHSSDLEPDRHGRRGREASRRLLGRSRVRSARVHGQDHQQGV